MAVTEGFPHRHEVVAQRIACCRATSPKRTTKETNLTKDFHFFRIFRLRWDGFPNLGGPSPGWLRCCESQSKCHERLQSLIYPASGLVPAEGR